MPSPTSLRLLTTLHVGKHPSRPFSAQTHSTCSHSRGSLFNKNGFLPHIFYNFCKERKCNTTIMFPHGGSSVSASSFAVVSPSSALYTDCKSLTPRWALEWCLALCNYKQCWSFQPHTYILMPWLFCCALGKFFFFFFGQEIFFKRLLYVRHRARCSKSL